MRKQLVKLGICAAFLSALTTVVYSQAIKTNDSPLSAAVLEELLVSEGKKIKSNDKLNRVMIAEVNRRKADFILDDCIEAKLRKLRADDALLKAIRLSVPASRIDRNG